MTENGRSLLRGAGRRLAGAILVLWVAITLTFVAVRVMPGSVEDVILGVQANQPGLREQVQANLGLDRPLIEQYLSYLGGIFRGDFGRSYVLRAEVGELIASQIWATLQLAVVSLAVASLLAWVVAVTTSGGRPWVVRTVSVAEILAICIPTFWLGSLLLLQFSFHWNWFPSSGADGWKALVLPVVALALPIGAILSQFLREEMGKQQRQPYVLTARSRGIGSFRLRAVHLVPNAAVASLALAGNMLGVLLGGAVIVETVFGRPGLGRTLLAAVAGQDVPVILAVVLIVAGGYVLISLAVDLLAMAIDPRLREVAP